MNIYSRALRHISIKDVKKKHQEKIDEKIQEEVRKKEERQYIQSVMETKKYDWRKELNEGMTSSGTFFTTLPSTGDVDLFSVDVGNSSSYLDTQDVGYNSGLTINAYGIDAYAITNVIDTSTSDSISFTGSSNINFSTASDLEIFWYNNDTGAYGDLNGISKTSTSSSTYNVTLPLDARDKNVDFTIYQVRSSSGRDFEGKQIFIGSEQESITSNNSGLIVSLLINYDGTNADAIDWGQLIMSNFSRNTTTFDGVSYPNLFYPGYTAPVSGNAGDPNIDGINSTLSTLKAQNSIGFTGGFIGNNTQQQMINLFADTNMDASALYTDLNAWENAFDLSNSYYSQYVNYDLGGNTSLANYYLNLSNQQAAIADTKETAVMSRINSASVLPDSKWTDADFAKVSQDIYNLYKNSSTYTITNFSTKRKTPVNVFVSLDSPEASAFIRTDPIMASLSPEERQKKLKEMLESGDEYVLKILGADFPGTGAVPPGEYDPFKQAPPGEAGDTPGVEISNFDTSKMEKDYGQTAGSMNTPSGATKFMKDLMKDGFGGNVLKTTVNGQRMTGRPAEILQQIQLNFPGEV
jgi:hypothetical protein